MAGPKGVLLAAGAGSPDLRAATAAAADTLETRCRPLIGIEKKHMVQRSVFPLIQTITGIALLATAAAVAQPAASPLASSPEKESASPAHPGGTRRSTVSGLLTADRAEQSSLRESPVVRG